MQAKPPFSGYQNFKWGNCVKRPVYNNHVSPQVWNCFLGAFNKEKVLNIVNINIMWINLKVATTTCRLGWWQNAALCAACLHRGPAPVWAEVHSVWPLVAAFLEIGQLTSPHPPHFILASPPCLLINTQELSQVQAADTNHAAEGDKLDQEYVFKERSAAGGPKHQGQVSPGRGSPAPP